MMPLSYVQGFSFADRSYRVMSVNILFTIETLPKFVVDVNNAGMEWSYCGFL